MVYAQDFAIEPLESRLEQFYCHFHSYLGTCSKTIWGITIYYPCWRWKFHCHW